MSFLSGSLQPFLQGSIAQWLVVATAIGLVLSLLAHGNLRLLARCGPTIQTDVLRMYGVAILSVLLLCAIWIQPPFPAFNVAQARSQMQVGSPMLAIDDLNEDHHTSGIHRFGRQSDALNSRITDAAKVRQDLEVDTRRTGGLRTPLVLVGVWMFVFAILALRLSWGLFRTLRWSQRLSNVSPGRIQIIAKELGLSATVLCQSSEIDSPITIGVFRSKVVVPETVEDWNRSEVEMALRHELAHVGRRDVFWCTLFSATTCFFWPLVPLWILRRKHRQLIELTCDAAVLKTIGCSADYADLLTRIANQARPATPTGLLMADQSFIRQRIECVLTWELNEPGLHRILKGACLFAIAVLTLAMVVMRPSFAEPTQPREVEVASAPSDSSGGAVAQTASASNWSQKASLVDPAKDVIVVLDATDTLWPLSFAGQELRPVIFAVGTSDELLERLGSKAIDGLVSLQPYGFGYRSIELLGKTTQPYDDMQSIRIPPCLIKSKDVASRRVDLSVIRRGEGLELSKEWGDSEVQLDIPPDDLRTVEVAIPSGSLWWDMFQAGAQQAAKQGNLELTINRIQSRRLDSTPGKSAELIVYARREGTRGVVSSSKPNERGYVRNTEAKLVELQLNTDVDWIAYQLLLLVQESSVRPRQIWLWHPDGNQVSPGALAESINRQFRSFAFRESNLQHSRSKSR